MEAKRSWADWVIWGLALGYFLCYVPYSALTKALSGGLIAGMERSLAGLELLPITGFASMLGMFAFLTLRGWWKHAASFEFAGMRLPRPTRWTFLSGLATSAVVATTTLAYTFDGVSIVFMMLLMRGGVLVIAPIVDRISGRDVRWYSWVALVLSFGALLAAFSNRAGYEMTLVAGFNVFFYVLAYFVRLRFMSRLAKSETGNANVRFFVEEQMVATPGLMVFLTGLALFGGGTTAGELVRSGFVLATELGVGLLAILIAVGLLSQGTGIFGGLILLDKRENTYCIPVNRASSILAGIAASYSLALLAGHRLPPPNELVGAGLIVVAILFLSLPPLLEKRRAAASAATPGLSA